MRRRNRRSRIHPDRTADRRHYHSHHRGIHDSEDHQGADSGARDFRHQEHPGHSRGGDDVFQQPSGVGLHSRPGHAGRYDGDGGEQTIDNNLASGRKSGYTFTYTPGEKVNGAIRSYTITAVPDQVGSTGQRRFYSDESGEIHYNAAAPADATSPVIQ